MARLGETVFWLAICVLVSFRASDAISQEEGPFSAFSRFQTFLTDRTKPSSRLVYGEVVVDRHPWAWVATGIGCALCVGVYASLAVLLIAFPLLGITDWREFVLYWGCIAGGQTVIHKVVG